MGIMSCGSYWVLVVDLNSPNLYRWATVYRDEAKVQRPTADLTPRRLTFVPIRRLLALTVVALGGITMTVAGGVKVAHSGAPTSFLLLAAGIFLVVLSLVGFATRANWRR